MSSESSGVTRLARWRGKGRWNATWGVTAAAVVAAALVVAGCGGGGGSAASDGKTVKVAVVAPLSGAFAASGQDILAGAKLAAKEINAAGGIKSLGGSKIQIITADAGDSPETATSAARDALNKQPVAAIGCWYSSLTLAATQVAEQKRIPWVTGSASDELTSRGFHYTFKISEGISQSAAATIKTLRQASNASPPRLGIIADNNVASVPLVKLLKQKFSGSAGSVVSTQSWTPPLSDATPPVTATLRANPSVVFVDATSTTDASLILKQLAAQRNTAPVVMGASSAVNPAFLSSVGAKGMDGVLVPSSVSFPGKGSAAIVKKWVAATGKPYMSIEGFTGWSNMWIIDQALEKAGKADPQAVQQALHTLDARNVPALAPLPHGNEIKFQANGLRVGVTTELLQWQHGRPQVISPPEVATGKLERRG